LRDALSAGASEGRLLAMVATEARREGAFGVAQQAATRAVQASPVSVAYRVLLASILVERSEGVPALTLLAGLPKDQLVLDVMRAKASLSADDHEAQRAALTALQAGPKHDAASVEITALRLRLQAALDPGEHLLREARSLLHRAPGDPESLRAVGEVALALHEPAEALSALESLCKLLPRDADAQHLLGRARRMSIDAPGAEVALRRALELVPDHQGALGTLAALQLDVGRYAAADDLYQRIAMRDPLTGRVGRAEALIGLGRLADAQSQLSGLPENQRGIDIVREVGARVALAAHHPGEALTLLRPLVEGEDRRSTTFVVYGDALFAADQVDAAAGAYDAALGIDPELPEALLGRAEVQLRAQRFKEALEFLDRAKVAVPTRLRPPSVRVRMLTLYGHTYVDRAKHGDYAVARDLLREAVQDPSVPPDAHFWLGEALGGRKTAESAAALKRYLELQPEGPYAARAKKALGPLL
jgi:tetratricopeptide (TPR) repeat protein